MSDSPGNHPSISAATPATDADRAWTFEAVHSVSRTFTLTIELLEEPVDAWVCTGYLLCRIADTIEDDPSISPRERARLLELYDDVLDPDHPATVETFLTEVEPHRPEDPNADWQVVGDTERVFRVFASLDPDVQAAMRSVVREMATGMADFLRDHADEGGLRLRTVDELEEYCWYVAGTVGKLLSNLFRVYGAEETDPEDARQFALLLQLVNIAKDVRDDYETENNVYLPGELLEAEGIDHEAVADPSATDSVARVVARITDRATNYADGARRYLRTLPEDEIGILAGMGMPYLLAIATIRELNERAHEAVTTIDAVKMSREEVELLYAEMASDVTHEKIDRLAETVRERPYTASED
ncbi:squalene/phytoene synthase [Halosegnis rubeus]|jgi:farnesyl-diphosphate farnesyltransferase|uniref:Squalene/phytoene synthase n=1 Tax=Halosegnis rubeus TaxID=2212850 RepID=A0A5N5U9I1_9EURY|nr:phytoene/squalene synthase family protein [Halosegnis rubeus]KAB7515285.1 squalene/phytoene synthase [Halosegnis rubeus]KAB7516339.1 squalene/phytoene synthase [Halosegnis rubeus]KAB7517673.1 squalene/phytoene synthase [Halosegnis rubeus]